MQISCSITCCDNSATYHIGRMNTYLIGPSGNGFQIIETYPDGRHSFIGGFSTEAAAQAWLDNYLRMRKLNEEALGTRKKADC
jgi:hypothetical protein